MCLYFTISLPLFVCYSALSTCSANLTTQFYLFINVQISTTAKKVTPNFLPYSGDYEQIFHSRSPSLTLGQSFCICGRLRGNGKGFRMSNNVTTLLSIHSSSIQGVYNQPVRGLCSTQTQSHPTTTE